MKQIEESLQKPCVEDYIKRMKDYFIQTKKNCYAWLTTLDENDLIMMSPKHEKDEVTENSKIYDEIAKECALKAYRLEMSNVHSNHILDKKKEGEVINLFRVYCALALLQKCNMIETYDASQFFDPFEDITVTATEKYHRFIEAK